MDSSPRPRARTVVALLALFALLACGEDDTSAAPYTVPGDRVFPEGIACDHATGDLYVGSTQDGAVYRGSVEDPGELELFLRPGEDGRDEVTGMKVDGEGRLFLAGRRSGRAYVYETGSGELLRAFDTVADGAKTLVNDVTVTEDAAYLTDSFRPVVLRVPLDGGEVGEMEPWLDLTGTPVPIEEGFNLNGITASDDGRYLLTVHAVTGGLYRIDTTSKEVVEVDLGGDSLRTGDGLLLDGTLLFAVVTEPRQQVVPVELSADLATGKVGDAITDPSFDYPTTIAQCGDDRLQVVNSQLDREDGGDPDLPFTVSEVEVDIP